MASPLVFRKRVGKDLADVRGNVRRAIVTRFPYAVFYQVEPKRVVVLAVIHTARDPRLWPQPRK